MAKPHATCLLLTVFLVLCGLVLVFASKPNNTPANDPSLIQRINSMRLGWKAKAQKVFEGKTLGELKRLFPMDSSVMANFKDILDEIQQHAKDKEQTNNSGNRDSTVSNSNTGTKVKPTKTRGKKTVVKQSKKTKSVKPVKPVKSVKPKASSKKKLSVKTKNTPKLKPTRKVKRNYGGVATLAKKKSSTSVSTVATSSVSSIPSSFDARERWPNCMPQIRQQFECGSCYAFTATGALAHRFCVATGGRDYPDLAPDYLVRCNSQTKACNGGKTLPTWEFLESTGVPTSQCVMYRSGYWNVQACPEVCDDGATPLKMYKTKPGTLKKLESDDEIKRSIMKEGSVHTIMILIRDFINYEVGVYKVSADTIVGAHAVQLIGWGQEDGDDYWLGVNSWGEGWGLGGFFKIKVGILGIGRQTYTAKPQV